MTIQDLLARDVVPTCAESNRREQFWHGPVSTDVSKWIRQLYPVGSDQAHTVQDVDWMIRNYRTKQMLVIETKCNMGTLSGGQWDTYKTLNAALRVGLPAIGWKWLGCWVLTYPGATFPTETVYFAPFEHCTRLTVRDHPDRRERYKMTFAEFESIMLSI